MNTNSTQPEMPTTPEPSAPSQPEMTSSAPPATTASPQAAPQQPMQQGVSEDTKTLITVLLLIFVFPIGLIVMFFWPKWKWWVKLLIALPLLLFVPLFLIAMLIAVNPKEQIDKAECMTSCQESGGTDCVEKCSAPTGTSEEVTDGDTEQQFINEELGFKVVLPSDWPQLEMKTEDNTATFVLPLQTPYQGETEQVVFWILKDYMIPEGPGPFYQQYLSISNDATYVYRNGHEGVFQPDSVDEANFQKFPDAEALFAVVDAGFSVRE